MTSAAKSTTALGTFLRSRRARLSPEDAGLPRGDRRRTPGLRREELAAIAGISVDYYIRLERGTERHPSSSVIDALARGLRLDADEHAHLRELVARVDRTERATTVAPTRDVGAGVRLILEQLRPFPAYVTTRIGDLSAWNPAGIRMFPGIEEWPSERRNVARYAFLHPAAVALYADREGQLTGLVSGLRQLAAIEPEATDLAVLVGELLADSPAFARLWERYDIDRYRQGSKVIHHPDVGDLTLTYQVMRLDGTGGMSLLSYWAEPGTAAHDAFVHLDRVGDAESPLADSTTTP